MTLHQVLADMFGPALPPPAAPPVTELEARAALEALTGREHQYARRAYAAFAAGDWDLCCIEARAAQDAPGDADFEYAGEVGDDD